jgi:hypothetical protein
LIVFTIPKRRKRRNQQSNQQVKNGNKMVTPGKKRYKNKREHMFDKNPQALDFIEFRER